jgi:hypothetical protein
MNGFDIYLTVMVLKARALKHLGKSTESLRREFREVMESINSSK